MSMHLSENQTTSLSVQQRYYKVTDIMTMIGKSRNWCYDLIKSLNDYVIEQGLEYRTMQGRVPVEIFNDWLAGSVELPSDKNKKSS